MLEVPIHVDLQDGYIMQVMGLVDAEYNASFLSQEFLECMVPHLLKQMTPFCQRVQGIMGEAIAVTGKGTMPCRIAKKCLVYEFVVER